MNGTRWWLPALVLAVGIGFAGWAAGHGVLESRRDRYVTVKGLAERDVEADLALWPFQIVGASDDLSRAQADVQRSTRAVLTFLSKNGIDTAGVELQGLEVTDRLAVPYGDPNQRGMRYTIQQLMVVRSEDVAAVQAASQRVGELVDAGVLLRSGTGWGPVKPTFLFTRLNDLKPSMIAEATASAREAAAQFAKDSGSEVGGIRTASQGVFQILPRDQAPGINEADQRNKTVRVVTTVQYYLD